MNEPGMGRELVVDTSVVVKFYLREPDSEKADILWERFGRRDLRLVILDLVFPELVNIFWVKTAQGELLEEEANQRIGHFLRAARHMEIVSVRSILRETFQLALVLGHAAYDVAFLAAAEFRDIQLVTADEKFYRKALRLTDRVVLLRNL